MEENNLNISDKSSLRFIKTPKLENSSINIKSDTEDSSIKTLRLLLEIPRYKRTKKDIVSISEYLIKTELINKFAKDLTNQASKNKLLYNCSNYMEFRFIKEGEILFKIDEKADKFYVILKGEMDILKFHTLNEMKMNAEQYFSKLIDMINRGQEELAKYTIKENNTIFPIKVEDLYYLKDILFKIKYRKSIFSDELNEVSELFRKFEKNPAVELNLDLNTKVNVENFRRRSLTYINNNNLCYNLSNYLYIENSPISKNVKFIDYYNFLTIRTGNCFGDMGLQNKTNTRTATIKAAGDCYLGYINIEQYYQFISSEKNQITNKEMIFIIQNSFFKKIPQNIFKTKYFNDFISINIMKGDYLFRENNESDYLYFIREGNIQLSISKINLKEINSLIKSFSSRIDITDDIINLNVLSESELLKKRKLEMFQFGQKQLLGIEEYCYGLKRFCSAKVISANNKIYKISYKLFDKIYKEEELESEVKHLGREKLLKFISRLKEIRNCFINMIMMKKETKTDLIQKEQENFTKYMESKKSPNINSIEQILKIKEKEYYDDDNNVITQYKKRKFYYRKNEINLEDIEGKIYKTEEINSNKIKDFFFTEQKSPPKINLNNSSYKINTSTQLPDINEKLMNYKKDNVNKNLAFSLNLMSFEDLMLKKIRNIGKRKILHSESKKDFEEKLQGQDNDLFFEKYIKKIKCKLMKNKKQNLESTDKSILQNNILEPTEILLGSAVKKFPSFMTRSPVNNKRNKL